MMLMGRSKWILSVVEFVKIALNSVKERVMIMKIQRTFTKNPIAQQRCEKKVADYLRSIEGSALPEGHALQHQIRDLAECACKSKFASPSEEVLRVCHMLLFQTNKYGKPFGSPSGK